MKVLFHLIIIIISTFVLSCDDNVVSSKDEAKIFVYGTTTCGYTTQCRNSLADEAISFEFKNLSESGVGTEMWDKLTDAGVESGGAIPVVDVNGTVLVRPSLEEIKKCL